MCFGFHIHVTGALGHWKWTFHGKDIQKLCLKGAETEKQKPENNQCVQIEGDDYRFQEDSHSHLSCVN